MGKTTGATIGTPFQRFDNLVRAVLRTPHQPKQSPKPSPRKPTR